MIFDKFLKWFANSKVASILRVFFAIVISTAIMDFTKAGQLSFGNWQYWVIAGLVAAGPMISRWLNPADVLS